MSKTKFPKNLTYTKKVTDPSMQMKSVRAEPAEFTNEFSMFYCSILPTFYNLKCPKFLDDVKVALKKIRKFIYDINSSNSEGISEEFAYEKMADRCAYLYTYSIINSGVVYCQFLNYLRQNENTFVEIFEVKKLTICCLGGGPGVEAVALIKVLHDKIWRFNQENPNAVINVHVTVVDICAKWMFEGSAIVTALNNSSNFIHARKVKFEFEFLKADLLKPFDPILEDKIRKSNIVTIVKFMSGMRMSCIPKLQRMLNTVINCMEDNSCLFMLDTAGGIVFYSVTEVITNHKSSFLKQEFKHKAYRLHADTLQELEKAMDFRQMPQVSTLFPTLLTRVSSCFWMKKKIPEKNSFEQKQPEEKKIVQTNATKKCRKKKQKGVSSVNAKTEI